MEEAGLGGYIGEGAIAIIFEEMRGGFLAGWKTFEAPAVDEKNIQPAVIVVIVESDAAASSFEEIFVFVFAAENSFGVKAGFARDVPEGNAKVGGKSRSGSRSGSLRRSSALRKGC